MMKDECKSCKGKEPEKKEPTKPVQKPVSKEPVKPAPKAPVNPQKR